MPPKLETFKCSRCASDKARDQFAANQIKRSTRTCMDCTASAAQRSGCARQSHDLKCSQCLRDLQRTDFSTNQLSHRVEEAICTECTTKHRPQKKIDLSAGPRDQVCPHCGAALFAAEASSFCCASGKHALKFDDYFQSPGKTLLALFRKVWPAVDSKGKAAKDPRTGEQMLESFSGQSRRYNKLFSLAVHEIQSSSEEKELHLHTPATPANICIHGTMYRKIFAAEEDGPVRYLLVEPQQRAQVSLKLGLQKGIVTSLERLLLARWMGPTRCAVPVQ